MPCGVTLMFSGFSIQNSCVRVSKSASRLFMRMIELEPLPETQMTPGSARLAKTLWMLPRVGAPFEGRRWGPRFSSYSI